MQKGVYTVIITLLNTLYYLLLKGATTMLARAKELVRESKDTPLKNITKLMEQFNVTKARAQTVYAKAARGLNKRPK